MKKPKIIVKQKEDEEIPHEVMAEAIIEISRGMRKLMNSRLRREAIVVLIKDKSGVNKSVIEIVLNNLEQLEAMWIKRAT